MAGLLALLCSPLGILLCWSLVIVASAQQMITGYHTVKCYSCMSKFYESVWPHLSRVYRRPRNFTDVCNNNDDIDPRYMTPVDCPSICIKMWEESSVGGMRIRGHIRGCFDDILQRSFNKTIVQWYRWMHRDSCRQYKKRELLQLSPHEADDGYINVCTCYADYCNGSANLSGGLKANSDFLLRYWPSLLTLGYAFLIR